MSVWPIIHLCVPDINYLYKTSIKCYFKGNSGIFLYFYIRKYSEKLDEQKKRTSKVICVLQLWFF